MNTITSDVVAEALRCDIKGGRTMPGEVLRQVELAKRFGVSRIPVREALRQLEAEGVVVVHPNRGAVVRTFEPSELREIFDLRLLLEVDLLRRSLTKLVREDFEDMVHEISRARRSGESEWWREADEQFHRALYEPAQRPYQFALVMKLRNSIAHYVPAADHAQCLADDWIDDHLQIAEACKNGDHEAAVELLRHHLETAAQLTLGNISRDPRRMAARSK